MSRRLRQHAPPSRIAAAGAAIRRRPRTSRRRPDRHVDRAAAEDGHAPIYFQDPDGKPFYSLTPRKTPDGRTIAPCPRAPTSASIPCCRNGAHGAASDDG